VNFTKPLYFRDLSLSPMGPQGRAIGLGRDRTPTQ
jgi:hypothetical protein